jgi:hypothetical protein
METLQKKRKKRISKMNSCKTSNTLILRFFKIYLQNSIAEYIWQFFIKHQNTNEEKAVEALKLLCLVFEANPKYIQENIEKFSQVLLKIIKTSHEKINWKIIAQLAKTFHYLNDFKKVILPNVQGLRTLYLRGLIQLMFTHQGTTDFAYSEAVEKIIHLCFIYRSNPESICELIIRNMSSFLSEDIQQEGNFSLIHRS